MSVFSHPEFDGHEHVAFYHDRKSGLKAIIAIHNTNLGPALGGCRMWPYATDEEALRDVLRLSKGMTYKSAVANIKLGGGKAVILGNHRTEKTRDLLLAMGDFVESLGGRYITAEDSGTSVADMKVIGERTRFAGGVVEGSEHGGDPSPTTAYGTYVGLKAAAKFRLGVDSLKGIRVAVQGVGNVGYRLAKHLHDDGAELVVSDIFSENTERAVRELGARVVEGDAIFDQDVDIFAPCALGAIINDNTIDRLKACVVAGAANNQLAEERHGELLRAREILYAPDYVINAGGIVDVYYQRTGESADKLKAHVEGIGDTLTEIFTRAAENQQPTGLVANKIAEERFNRA
ncbi:Glu/Leu/Phe/Val dehydrogenase dimerization domain-containing protein [Simiduia agarivorans]|uniref:Glu/Leu/Phe/Val dehydrogenase n=1 Tax=Simiduia agarivorans (strain DSM 21679 / JCM 13881 / BCRC 17597 / SA1) TaxID=1117647 RepID=K4KRS4_SIMAS|nr:Glu/Leu/Phe/Val dehydrogenase dimerization domain-containing protein [Simiduia agarivorans]AFV00854.1 Glu/Leu/Phe/Val dehydrogenase [Simiduia agarivorans SA1 = DSM 21679]